MHLPRDRILPNSWILHNIRNFYEIPPILVWLNKAVNGEWHGGKGRGAMSGNLAQNYSYYIWLMDKLSFLSLTHSCDPSYCTNFALIDYSFIIRTSTYTHISQQSFGVVLWGLQFLQFNTTFVNYLCSEVAFDREAISKEKSTTLNMPFW